MQNSRDNLTGEDNDDEWLSFCSSCKSILQSICSVGTASLDDVLINQQDTKTQINATNREPSEHASTDPYKILEKNRADVTINNSKAINKSHERAKYKMDANSSTKPALFTKEKIKRNEFLNVTDSNPYDKSEFVQNSIKSLDNNSKRVTRVVQNVAQRCANPVKLNLRDGKTETCEKHILKRRKKIRKMIESILYLSNCLEILRQIILQGLYKKQLTQ